MSPAVKFYMQFKITSEILVISKHGWVLSSSKYPRLIFEFLFFFGDKFLLFSTKIITPSFNQVWLKSPSMHSPVYFLFKYKNESNRTVYIQEFINTSHPTHLLHNFCNVYSKHCNFQVFDLIFTAVHLKRNKQKTIIFTPLDTFNLVYIYNKDLLS